jgi:hypothetical protein
MYNNVLCPRCTSTRAEHKCDSDGHFLVCVSCHLEGPQHNDIDSAIDAFEDMMPSDYMEACPCGEYPQVIAVKYTAMCSCGYSEDYYGDSVGEAAAIWNRGRRR